VIRAFIYDGYGYHLFFLIPSKNTKKNGTKQKAKPKKIILKIRKTLS
jgi:hypothetical protein